MEPVAAGFYNIVDRLGMESLLPRTAEQAGATYYIIALIMFVVGRFICTFLMRFIKPHNILSALALLAFVCCMITILVGGYIGIYALVMISACMSLMFPTIYGMGIKGLGDDTKIGGSGMVMAIAGAAVLTQIQGVISDQSGSIKFAYWVPAIAFLIIAYYSIIIYKKYATE
jgi:FHS family L-fucose permease-like MFS transporter